MILPPTASTASMAAFEARETMMLTGVRSFVASWEVDKYLSGTMHRSIIIFCEKSKGREYVP